MSDEPKSMNAEVWESLGSQDPDWAVASIPGREHGGWADDLDAFYATGRERIDELYGLLPEHPRRRALDFGAGTGRLSFALARDFERVTCLDISRSMLATLSERAVDRGVTNLDVMEVDGFRPAGDHDLAVSLIVLQHVPDRDAVRRALALMVESLRPGGLLVAEIPLRPHTLKARIQPRLQAYRALRRVGFKPTWLHNHGLSGISMLCVPKHWTESVLRDAGAELVDMIERRGTYHQQVYYLARRV